MAIRTRVRESQIIFSSETARMNFFARANGKDVLLTIDERPSQEIRAYFEGCVVPAFYYWHPSSGWSTFSDAREVLKLQFLQSREIRTLDGKLITQTQSLADVGNERFKEFVTNVTEWMIENGMPAAVLDSESYKLWRDLAQKPGAVYPPLQRLMDDYESQNA